MDTKLKKRKPAVTFVFFFLSLSAILAGVIFMAFAAFGVCPMPALDYKDTERYKGAVDNLLQSSRLVVTGQQDDINDSLLANEQNNIAYYIITDEGTVFTQGEGSSISASDFVAKTRISMPTGRGDQVVSGEVAASDTAPTETPAGVAPEIAATDDLIVGYEGNSDINGYESFDYEDWSDLPRDGFVPEKLSPDGLNSTVNNAVRDAVNNAMQDVDMQALLWDYSYSGSINPNYEHFIMLQGDRYYEESFDPLTASFKSDGDSIMRSPYSLSRLALNEGEIICIAVRHQFNLQNNGEIYASYYNWYQTTIIYICLAILMGLALLTILIVIFKHRSLSLATNAIGRAMGHVWIEPKIIISVFAIFGTLAMLLGGGISLYWLEVIVLLIAVFWWFWLCMTDLSVNGGKTFAHNSFNSARSFLERLEGDLPVITKIKRRPVILACAEILIALALLALFMFSGSFFSLIFDEDPILLAGMVVAAALGLFLLAGYLQKHNKNADELGRVMRYAEEIKSGTANEPLTMTGELSGLAGNLTDIHNGISRAVDNQTRSERMKVELITNVSHDLKTPLTSIMNYVDLLGREDLRPEHANDYVKVLSQKSERLKNMIQDLFDVSKAHSGATELHPERIDAVALVEQTVAEMGEMISGVGVEVKAQLSPQPLYVYADGGKLHRVFENLLGNALKYSLGGTRVYIDVKKSGDLAEISFKNVASYEMTFTADEIVERFQRGDTSRSTDGSGLGLAIAKSFLELCGGTLRIELDGDLFKAIVSIPLHSGDTPPATQPVVVAPQPSAQPQIQPTAQPQVQPTAQPQTQPSAQPQTQPSAQPQTQPTAQPQIQPAAQPQTQPSAQPQVQPTAQPQTHPTAQPQTQPTAQPQTQPTAQPQTQPTVQPQTQPTAQPQVQPTVQPQVQTAAQPQTQPTAQPQIQPTVQPQTQPTAQPQTQPSAQPQTQPSAQPQPQQEEQRPELI